MSKDKDMINSCQLKFIPQVFLNRRWESIENLESEYFAWQYLRQNYPQRFYHHKQTLRVVIEVNDKEEDKKYLYKRGF